MRPKSTVHKLYIVAPCRDVSVKFEKSRKIVISLYILPLYLYSSSRSFFSTAKISNLPGGFLIDRSVYPSINCTEATLKQIHLTTHNSMRKSFNRLTNEAKLLGVSYENIIPLLVEGIDIPAQKFGSTQLSSSYLTHYVALPD